MDRSTSLVSGRSRVRVPQPAPLPRAEKALYLKALSTAARRALRLFGGEQNGTDQSRNARLDAESPQKVPKEVFDSFSALPFLVRGGVE